MGKLFVIEGTDGSGKQTQSTLLQQRLKEKNIDFKSVSFPNYENDSSALVKMYLNGNLEQMQKKSVHILHQHFLLQIDMLHIKDILKNTMKMVE